MAMKHFVSVVLILMQCNFIFAQNKTHYEEINEDVWERFYLAYTELDAKYMEEIHSKEVMRIPADSKKIFHFEQCISNYERSFSRARDKGEARKISLRFIERIANEKSATERGIYQLTVNPGAAHEANYYGKFHVILRKESGVWKILVDYDSSEGNTIGKEDFDRAFAIDDFEAF